MINLRKKFVITFILGMPLISYLFISYFEKSYKFTFVLSQNISLYNLFAILISLLVFLFWVYKYFDSEEKESHRRYLVYLFWKLKLNKFPLEVVEDFISAKILYKNESKLKKAPIWYILEINDEYYFKRELLEKLSDDNDIEKILRQLNIKYDDNNEVSMYFDDMINNYFNTIIQNIKVIEFISLLRYSDFDQINITSIDIETFSKSKYKPIIDKDKTYDIILEMLKWNVYIIDKRIYYFLID